MKIKEAPLKAIKCNNIYTDSKSPPISGLLIFSSIFEEIINFSMCSESEKNEYLKAYEIIDCSELYIFPGIIDMNTHLNSNHEDPEWSNFAEITKLSIQGGITTLIDNPLMNKYDQDFNEINCLENRISKLKGNIYTDCGLFAYIGKHNYESIEEIHKTHIPLGYKIHLTKTWIPELPIMNKAALGGLMKKISENEFLYNILISVHCVFASDKEMFMCSPLRKESKEKRLNLNLDIRNSHDFAGGLPEDFDGKSKEEDPMIQYLSDDQIDDWINCADQKNNLTEIEKLEIQAKIIGKFQEENSIAKMELFQYNSKDSPLMETYEQSSSSAINSAASISNGSDSESPKEKHDKTKEFSLLGNIIPIKTGFTSIQAFSNKKPTPLLVKNKLTSSEKEKHEDLNIQKEEVKTADYVLRKGADSFKLSTEPSKLLSRRLVTSVSVISENSIEKFNSLKSINSFEAIKLQDLKVDQKTNKDKENKINHSYEMYVSNHSLSWETKGIRLVLNKAEKFSKNQLKKHKLKLFFMNLSSNSLLFQINHFKKGLKNKENLEIYTEVCTPYLYFHTLKIKESLTKFKISPPIRIKKERDLFLQTLKLDSFIDVVSSFHSFVPWTYKFIDKGNFRRSLEGLSCIGFNLQILWTKLFEMTQKVNSKSQAIKLILEHENMILKALQIEAKTYNNIMKIMIQKLCENPAKILNLENKKGKIAKGIDADFIIWNPFKCYKINTRDLPLKETKGFIFNNVRIYGEIKETYLRGQLIFKRNEKAPHFYQKHGEILTQYHQNP